MDEHELERWPRLHRYTESYLIVGWCPALIFPIALILSTLGYLMDLEGYAECIETAKETAKNDVKVEYKEDHLQAA